MQRKYSACVNSDNDSVVDFLNSSMEMSAGYLNIFHINARSIPAHIDDLSYLLSSSGAQIVGVSETWLSEGMPNGVFQIPGFQMLRNDRNSRGGGVGFYVRDNLKVKVVNMSFQKAYEALFVEISLCGGKMLAGIVYNPRWTVAEIDDAVEFISASMGNYHHIVIMGDLNLNMANPSSQTKYFIDLMTSLSFEILPFSNTRLSSTLDWIMIASINSDRIFKLGQTSIPGISDHDLIFITYRYRYPKSENKYNFFRDYSKLNINSFLIDSLSRNWLTIYECADINSKVKCFNDIFNKLFNDHVPFKRKLCKSKITPWFNNSIFELIKKRDHALLVWRKSKNPTDWSLYTKLRNKTSLLIRDCKRRCFFNRFNMSHNRNKVWNDLRQVGIAPSNNNANTFTAEEFNKQFSNVPIKPVVLPMSSTCTDFEYEFSFIAFSETEVALAVDHIKSNAIGHDNIIPRLIKILIPVILPYITHIFNYIVTTCTFPDSWKLATVVPVPKSVRPYAIEDFRPISLLPYLSKVFELLLYRTIKDYLDDNNLL